MAAVVGSRTALIALVAFYGCSDATRSPDAGVPDFGSTLACQRDGDCPKSLPTCEPLAKVCVGCLSGMMTCSQPGYVCDDTTHTCVPGDPNAPCRFNADCAFPRTVCQLSTGQCVGCLSDGDCPDPSKAFCDSFFDGGVTFTCLDDCQRCRGALPLCQRDLGLCCPVDGGGCRAIQ